MSNTSPDNTLDDTPGPDEGEGGDWANVAIAVKPETKRMIEALAERQGLRPSPFLRSLLLPLLTTMARDSEV